MLFGDLISKDNQQYILNMLFLTPHSNYNITSGRHKQTNVNYNLTQLVCIYSELWAGMGRKVIVRCPEVGKLQIHKYGMWAAMPDTGQYWDGGGCSAVIGSCYVHCRSQT